jgi:hypothetical protein
MIAHRCALASLLTIAAATSVAAQDAAPLPSIQITLPPAHARWHDTVATVSHEAATLARDWLGAHPSGTITPRAIAPPAWHGRGAMVVERHIAKDVIRSWWPATPVDQHAGAILDGFAWYLQSRAIERVFDQRYLRTAYSVESTRHFGDTVVWSYPTLRLSRWTAGLQRHTAMAGQAEVRFAAVFATLERWLGEPVLQGAMLAVAQLPVERLSGSNVVNTISLAAGQDLTWLFVAAADAGTVFDYAVTSLASAPVEGACPAPCFDTSVTVARLGEGHFSGRSSGRVGEFDSGDAMAVRITLANGEHAWARWDGRDSTRTFRFRGPAAATAAHVDPERVLVLDRNYLNNAIVTPSPTNVPVRKWMARWLVWMQNAALSYGFFA